MPAHNTDTYIAAATTLAQAIIKRSEKDAQGCYWKTMSIDKKNDVFWQESNGLYSGNAGIALFLVELFAKTKNSEFLDVATSATERLRTKLSKADTFRLPYLVGDLGVVAPLIRLYQVTSDSKYLSQALDVARLCAQCDKDQFGFSELLNGAAGIGHGYLTLAMLSQDEFLIRALDYQVNKVLSDFHLGATGIYWDRNPQQHHGLCGFSHGACGVGFFLYELYAITGNSAFAYAGDQSFLYEQHYFNSATGNWPDFRGGIDIHGEDFYKENLKAGKLDPFISSGEMVAWCHGAPGIGLSRLRAYEVSKRSEYLNQAKIAIETTKRASQYSLGKDSKSRTYILCHGLGGNADIFIEAARVIGEKEYLSLAYDVADQIVEEVHAGTKFASGFRAATSGEDISLFMGNAGIGHFLLRCSDPLGTPSILCPKIAETGTKLNTANTTALEISVSEIRARAFAKLFPVSASALSAPEHKSIYDAITAGRPLPDESELDYFRAALTKHELKMHDTTALADILRIELQCLNLDQSRISDLYDYINTLIVIENTQKDFPYTDTATLDLILKVTDKITVDLACLPWEKLKQIKDVSSSVCDRTEPFLIRRTALGSEVINISPLHFNIIVSFSDGARKVAEVIKDIECSFDELSPTEISKMRELTLSTIKTLYLMGYLST